MILQALNGYFDRSDDLPKQGWIRRGVDYSIVLDEAGVCLSMEALGTLRNGKTFPKEMLLPSIGKQALKHTNSGKDANFLWDNASFIFGRGKKGDQKLSAFINTLLLWSKGLEDPGVSAVWRFCTNIKQDPEIAVSLFHRFQVAADFDKRDPVIVFRLSSDIEGVHTRAMVRDTYEHLLLAADGVAVLQGNCLVTGLTHVHIASNETVIKGVWKAQTSGANIVSFNKRSFESYGKTERNGENAPVSIKASFAYTTALNHLLRAGSTQRIQVGDASTVFWADQASDLESTIPDIFGDPPKDDPDRNAQAVRALFAAMRSGQYVAAADANRFHILGLSPNNARISVRFYHCLKLAELGVLIAQHFRDVELVRGRNDPQHPSLHRLLKAVCGPSEKNPDGDLSRIPNLGGAIVDAVFAGPDVPYPSLWLNAAVGRCRAEQSVNYFRAAAIKACLNRQIRRANSSSSNPSPEKEFLPMLDPTNPSPAYRMGRLFAALEKIQEEASPGINATIRDRYYGAASSTPVAVFTTLLRLKNSHIKKLATGRGVWFEKLLADILGEVADFPRQLPLPDQGRFALGYYHQRQDFFAKKPVDTTPTPEGDPA